MKRVKTFSIISILLVVKAITYADTFYLKSGIVFDGKIIGENPNGVLTIKVGTNTLYYRKDEIEKIEKNDKTGEIKIDDFIKEWEEKDKYLTQVTGLNKEQRAQIESILGKLQWGEEIDRASAKNALLELNKKFNIYP